MNHAKAVQIVTRELGFQPMTPELLEAFRFLVDHADSIEELAEEYISVIENGILEAWVDFYEENGTDEQYQWELEDQRLMSNEESAYVAAHMLLDIDLEWPEGYLETAPKVEE